MAVVLRGRLFEDANAVARIRRRRNDRRHDHRQLFGLERRLRLRLRRSGRRFDRLGFATNGQRTAERVLAFAHRLRRLRALLQTAATAAATGPGLLRKTSLIGSLGCSSIFSAAARGARFEVAITSAAATMPACAVPDHDQPLRHDRPRAFEKGRTP
jgi:hypothetical protein